MSSFAVGLDLRYDGKNKVPRNAGFTNLQNGEKFTSVKNMQIKMLTPANFFFISYIHVYRDRLVENLKN